MANENDATESEYEPAFEGTRDKPIIYRVPPSTGLFSGDDPANTLPENFADEIGPIPKTLAVAKRDMAEELAEPDRIAAERAQMDALNIETNIEKERLETDRRLFIDAEEAREQMGKAKELHSKKNFVPFSVIYGDKIGGVYEWAQWRRFGLDENGKTIILDKERFENISADGLTVQVNDRNRYYDNLGIKTPGDKYGKGKMGRDIVPYIVNTDLGYAVGKAGKLAGDVLSWAELGFGEFVFESAESFYRKEENLVLPTSGLNIIGRNLRVGPRYLKNVIFDYPGIESMVGPKTNERVLNWFSNTGERIDSLQEADVTSWLLDFAHKGVYKYSNFIVPEDQRKGIVQPNSWTREDFENMLNPENAEFTRDWAGFLGENLGGFKIFQMVTKTGRKASVAFFEKLGLDAAEDLLKPNNLKFLPEKYRGYSPMQLWKTKELYPQLAQRAVNIHKLRINKQSKTRIFNLSNKITNLGATMRIEAATEPGRLYTMMYGSEFAGSWSSALAEHRFNIDRENPYNTGIEILTTLTAPSVVIKLAKSFEKPTLAIIDTLVPASDLIGKLYQGSALPTTYGSSGDSMFKLISNYLKTGSVDGPDLDLIRIPTNIAGKTRTLTGPEKNTMFKFVQAMNADPENKLAAIEHIKSFMQSKADLIELGVPESEITPMLTDIIKLSYMQDATAHMMNANNLGFKVRNSRKIKTNMKWIETFSQQLKSQNVLSNRLVQKYDEIIARYGEPTTENYKNLNKLITQRTVTQQAMFNDLDRSLNEVGDDIIAKIAMGEIEGYKTSADIIAKSDDLTTFIMELSEQPINADEMSKMAIDAFETRVGRQVTTKEREDLLAGQNILGQNTNNINITSLALDTLDKELSLLAKGGASFDFIASNQKATISDSWGALIHKTSKNHSATANRMSQLHNKDGSPVTIDAISLVGELEDALIRVSPAGRYDMDRIINVSKVDALLEESWGPTVRDINNKYFRQAVKSMGTANPLDEEAMREAMQNVRKALARKVAKDLEVTADQVTDIKIFRYLAKNQDKISKDPDFSSFGKEGVFSLDIAVSDFYSILQSTNRRIAKLVKEKAPDAEITFLEDTLAVLNRYDQKMMGGLARESAEKYEVFKEWYKEIPVPFKYNNSHVNKVYKYKGIDQTGQSITGIYHGDGNATSQWLDKFINSHLNLPAGGSRELIKDLNAMFPSKIKNELGELVINPDRELAEKLLMRHLAVTIREGAIENHKKLLKMDDLTDADLDKYLENPTKHIIVNTKFDDLIEGLDEVTGGRISFSNLKDYKLKRQDSIDFIKANTEAYKDASKAVTSVNKKVATETRNIKAHIMTVQKRASQSGENFGGLVANLQANPQQFYEAVIANPLELNRFKKWAIASGTSEKDFNEMIAVQLARGISRKIRVKSMREAVMDTDTKITTSQDVQDLDLEMGNLLDDVKLAAVTGEEGLDKISFNEVVKILDNPTTVKLLNEYMPQNFKKMKVLFRGLTFTRRPQRTGLGTITDRSPSLDTAGLSSRGNALAQDRTGIRYQTAEMLMTLFFRNEIDIVAGLFLNKESVDVLVDLVVRGRMPPTKWSVSYKEKTGLWLPELISLVDQLNIYEHIDPSQDSEIYN